MGEAERRRVAGTYPDTRQDSPEAKRERRLRHAAPRGGTYRNLAAGRIGGTVTDSRGQVYQSTGFGVRCVRRVSP